MLVSGVLNTLSGDKESREKGFGGDLLKELDLLREGFA